MKTRFALLFGLLGAVGCADTADQPSKAVATADQPITDVPLSPGVQQTISDCWDMASGSWLESLSRRPAGAKGIDVSEGYISYIYWFVQIANPSFNQLNELGNWGPAVELTRRFGWMTEQEFLGQSEPTQYAVRHLEALQAVRLEILGGDLRTKEQRADLKNVFKVLNRAWGLTPEVVAELVSVFGESFDHSIANPATPLENTHLRRLSDIPVGTADDGTALTAADLVGEPADPHAAYNGQRVGKYAFSWTKPPAPNADPAADAAAMHDYFVRIEKSLIQDVPVLMQYFNDDKQDDPTGTYQRPASGTLVNPGSHLVMLYDATVQTPAFGLLPAGTNETRPEARAATTAADATFVSFRAKNSSWGNYYQPGQTIPSIGGVPGINDYTVEYLAMPYMSNGSPATGTRVLQAMVLPNDAEAIIER